MLCDYFKEPFQRDGTTSPRSLFNNVTLFIFNRKSRNTIDLCTLNIAAWADREWGIEGPDPPTPEKSENIVFFCNTCLDPLKNEKSQNYQASIQCWAIIYPAAKRHFDGVSLAGRW